MQQGGNGQGKTTLLKAHQRRRVFQRQDGAQIGILSTPPTDKGKSHGRPGDIEGGTKAFEGLNRKILDNQSLEVRKGDRMARGRQRAGENHVVETHQRRREVDQRQDGFGKTGCEIGYFHQDHATLDFNLNPVEQIAKLRPDFQYGDIRAALGRFQFSNEQVSTKLSQLSGGERARVALLKLLLEENNLLLMDEPTNHLDMDSKATLEEAILVFVWINYTGSLKPPSPTTAGSSPRLLPPTSHLHRIWELQDGVVTVILRQLVTDYVRAKKGLLPQRLKVRSPKFEPIVHGRPWPFKM